MTDATHKAAVHAIRTIPIRSGDRPALPTAPSTGCTACNLRDLCLPRGMGDVEAGLLDALMFARRRIKADDILYREGDRFSFIYAVRSGTFNSTLMLADGREQVTSFNISGELMGLDGVANGNHASTARALEDADVCAIPYGQLRDLAKDHAGMQQLVTRMMSRELVREHGVMLLLGSMSAEERLAVFLLNLSRRFKARGYSASEFHMRMSRAEIGSYLGLTLETVSRTFSTLQHHGLLEVDKRHIRIVDLERLAGSFDGRAH
jgi:CRP/FNR family transcriptional regulator